MVQRRTRREKWERGASFYSRRKPGCFYRISGGVDDTVLSLSTHGYNTRDSFSLDLRGRRRCRGARDVHVVISMGTEVCVMPGRQMLANGKQPKETQITLHVSAL